jgi:16S rRNA U516 pseudouridylate synthase RsuA-like enzyme
MVPCKPAHLEYISPTVARITLREGRYHQLRRMMASLGHHVVGIHRVSLGPLALGDLPAGHWRELTDQEVQPLPCLLLLPPLPPSSNSDPTSIIYITNMN